MVKLDNTRAIVCLVLNIILPGSGSMVSACAGEKFNDTALMAGIVQFLTSWLIIGWVWSVVHGIWLVDKSIENG